MPRFSSAYEATEPWDESILPKYPVLGEGEADTGNEASDMRPGKAGAVLRYGIGGGVLATGAGLLFYRERWLELGLVGLFGGIAAGFIVAMAPPKGPEAVREGYVEPLP